MTIKLDELLEINIPTYNRAEKLRSTLEQILSEDSPLKDCSVTVLNNDSTDGTFELLNEYSSKYQNLKVINHKKNIGGSANVARAFEIAQKKYVWVLCDDDTYNWDGWEEIQTAIWDGYDVIFTRKLKNEIGEIFYSASFVPAAIYKTEKLTYTVYANMLDNLHNLFPQLALIAKNINDESSMYFPKNQYVNIGLDDFSSASYVRGLYKEQVPKDRQDIFFTVGYLSSVQLIKDRKKQIQIINDYRHSYKSLYSLFKAKILKNKVCYKSSVNNLHKMQKNLSFSQKIKFLFALIEVYLFSGFFNNKFFFLEGKYKWEQYFNFVNEQSYIDALAKKFKRKKILIYGAGLVAEVLFESYDFSGLNVIGISDKKITEESYYKGIKAISPDKITQYNPDIILFTTYSYENILKEFKNNGVKSKGVSLIKKNWLLAI